MCRYIITGDLSNLLCGIETKTSHVNPYLHGMLLGHGITKAVKWLGR